MVYKKEIISLLIIILISVSIYSCDEKFKPVKTSLDTVYIPDYESRNAEGIVADSSKIKAVLRAGYIANFSKLGFTIIDSGATVDFYKNGTVVSTLTGDRGKVFEKTKDIEIRDNITVVNKEGSKLETSRLYWTEDTQRVSSDTFVAIQTPSENIQGIGFESDQGLKNYKIFKVTGTFRN